MTTSPPGALVRATRDDTALRPASLEQVYALADRLAQSTLIPTSLRAKPGDVAIVLLTGAELGLAPMHALRSIHVIQGRAVLSSDLIVGLVKSSPTCRRFELVESTGERATYETERTGEQPVRLSYTIDQAKAAGLAGKDTWRAYPDAMLRARCAIALARAVYPDVAAGLYEPDEGEEIARREQPQRAHAIAQRVAAAAPAQPATVVVHAADGVRVEHNALTGEVLNETPAPPPDALTPDEARAGLTPEQTPPLARTPLETDLAAIAQAASAHELEQLGAHFRVCGRYPTGSPDRERLVAAYAARQAALRGAP